MIDQIIAAIGEDNIQSTAEVEKVRRDYNQSITKVSNSLTGLTDAFYDILASRTNVANINRAVLKARESQSQENRLESRALASIATQPVSQETSINFDGLTSAINELNAAIDQYGLGGDDGFGIDDVAGGRRGRRGGTFGNAAKIAGGVAVAGGLGLAATQAKSSPSLNTDISGSTGEGIQTGRAAPVAPQAAPPAPPPSETAPSPSGTTQSFSPSIAASGQTYSYVRQALGADRRQWDIFRETIAEIESGGDYNVYGGSGNHYDGRYQLGRAAKIDGSRKVGVTDPGHARNPEAANRVAFRRNPTLQETLFAGFTAANHTYLSRFDDYNAKTKEQQLQILGYAHNQGMGGAREWMSTGVVGSDGFGTRGTKYTDELAAAFRGGASAAAPSPPPPTAVAQTAPTPSGRSATDPVNTDDITEAVRGRSIWDYARRNGSDIDYEGLKPGMKDRFLAMAIDYKQQTGNKVAINSANRTYAKQAELYRRYGPRRAAPPGRSKHESGVAIDINSPDAQRMIQLGLFEKYGFYRPYTSETWHIEPTEASRVGGQPDNPYQPGDPIVQTGESGQPIVQDAQGQTQPVTTPEREIGDAAAGVAIAQRQGEETVATSVVPIIIGSGQPQNPADYLGAVRPRRDARPQGRNPAREYKLYFAA